MLTFLTENLATIIIAVIVIGILAAIITKMIKDKKKGKFLDGYCINLTQWM